MSIPCFDLKPQYDSLKEEIQNKITEVCNESAFTNSSYVQSFENNFAKYCLVNHAIAVNSGTSALHLAMIALDIGPGDEVIVPANTFIATAWAPCYVGATPIFVDCDPNTWQIDPEEIKKKYYRKN